MKITFVTWDDDTDGVAVLHDGEQVWSESSFSSFDQYIKFHAPLGEPVELDWAVREGGELSR
jgi:hypothetical protein